jgi:hypothetical protein
MAIPPAAQERLATASITQEEIDTAVEKVKSDPNLGSQTTMKMLRWKTPERKSKGMDLSWLAWVAGLFGWGMQSARFLVWLTLALLVGWLGVYLYRTASSHVPDAAGSDTFVPPTHVRNLDIRPESLPPNIGAAARKMWERGDHRAALSLLYRGLLSRLTHVHRVPILDSSTEGDCLMLLPGRVPPKTGDYATQLVDAWRGFVYGGTAAASPVVVALCEGFSAALDRSAARKVAGDAE